MIKTKIGFTLLIFIIFFIAVLLSNDLIANWINPLVAGKALEKLNQGIVLFKCLLFIDGILLLFIFWKKQEKNIRTTKQLWRPKAEHQPSNYYKLTLFSIFIIAVITHSISMNSDLWIDEVFTVVNFVRLDLGQILSSYTSDNQHMLYSALANISVGIFGETAVAVRLPALLFGLASILATASLARYVFGNKEALFSAFLLAISYHHIWFSQNARGYTILLFGAIVATEFMLRGLASNRWRYWVGYALAITLASWAHLTGVFIAIAHALVYISLVIYNHIKISNNANKPYFNYLQPIIGFMLAAWFTIHVYAVSLPQLIEFFTIDPDKNTSTIIVQWTNPIWLISEMLRNIVIAGSVGWFGIVIACIVGLYGLFHSIKRDFLFTLLALIPVVLVGIVMLSLGRNLWPRMFFSEFSFFITLAVVGALGLGALINQSIKRNYVVIQYGPLILLCLIFSLSMSKVYQYPKQDFTSARDYVKQLSTVDDRVVALNMAGRVYQLYYAPEWPEINTIKELNEHRSKNGYTWVIYTLPSLVKSATPLLNEKLETEFDLMKTFPGTLGDGQIIVRRSKTKENNLYEK